jgi:2-amino-4-hydroxy-6-hydroxymethyldihydropteridine diphosphokinase
VTTVHLGLGANLGDRAAALSAAVSALGELPGCELQRVSSRYETEPWSGSPPPSYLNMAVALRTMLSPRDLHAYCLAIEARLGRVRGERWAPRTIDIDLILWGSRVVSEPGLLLPHPGFRDRRFVLVPLAELAPMTVDPVTGLTVCKLLDRCPDESSVVAWRGGFVEVP